MSVPASPALIYGPLTLEPYAEGEDPFTENYDGFTARLHADQRTGHMQFHPMPGPEMLDRYYNSTFFRSETPPTPETEYTQDVIDLAKSYSDYIRAIGNFPERYTMHDIGCGFGAFVWAWQQLSFTATGNEANRDWVARANPHCHNGLYVEPLEEALKKIGHKIDFFFTSHVLEHLPDPLQTLKIVAEGLSDDGILRIAVPNNQCFRVLCDGRRTGQDYLNQDLNSAFPMHLHFFSPKSMVALLRHAGLEPILVKTTFFDEVDGKEKDPEWAKQIELNLLGGQLDVLACKPGNRKAQRQPNMNSIVERAAATFDMVRQKQARNGLWS